MEQQTMVSELGLAEAIRFQRDLYLYWRLTRQVGGIPLTTRGLVARPLLRRLRAELSAATPNALQLQPAIERGDPGEGDEPRLFFLRRLLERLGLLRREESAQDGSAEGATKPGQARLIAAEASEMRRFLAHSLAERLRICERVWLAGGWWPDLPDPQTTPPRLLAPASPRVAIARRQVIETLLALAPGDPLSVAPPRRATPRTTRLRDTQRARVTASAAGPHDGETQRAALLGPLTWMGFVVAPPNADENTRLAGLPLAALRPQTSAPDDEVAALVEHAGRIIAQANLSIIAYPPLTAPTLLTLDTCAERVALDQTARYNLTRNALATALAEAQWDAQEVAAQVERLSGAPLPANARVTLSDWERHVERLRLTPEVTLLETRDAAELDALLADRAAATLVERRLSPTAALLTPGALAQARAWLLKRGRLPAIIHHTAETT